MQMKHSILFIILVLLCNTLHAQKLVQGTVKDQETGNPIEYVMIIGNISGKTTITNSEGRYQFNMPKEDSKLIFKHLDYFTKEITVDSSKSMNLKLQPSAESLDEIVILTSPLKDEINKAIKTSQANFSKDLKLNAYYRELMYINGTMYQYEDAELDYYLQSINKSNTVVRESRTIKFTNDEAKKFDSITNVRYFWGDLRERVAYEFDFELIKNIINNKEYEMYLTTKKSTDGIELNILNFNPVDDAKTATLSGTVTYGAKDYLIREIKANLDPKHLKNNKFNQQSNHRFKRSFYNKTTLFNLYNGKYALTYTSYRIFGVSEVANQMTKVGGFVELLVDSVNDSFNKPNPHDFYDSNKLTRLGKNYKTNYWQKFNVVPLTYKEEQMLKQINK